MVKLQPRTQDSLWASVWVLVSEGYPGTGDGAKQSDWLIFEWRKVPQALPTTPGSQGCDSKSWRY